MPKISIIIPFYNVEKYLNKCIDSVLNQTFKDFEIILVNDGSSDSCKNICEEYIKKDKRIRLINKLHEGISVARNTGLKYASANYIGFVDGDDYINKNMYMIMYQICQEHNCDIVQIVDKPVEEDNNNEDNNEEYTFKYNIKIADGHDALKTLYYGDKRHASTVVWSKLYKKEIFDGIEFPEGKINEDDFINYKLYFKTKKIIFVDAKLYYYRQRQGSIMRKKYNLNRLDVLDAYEERVNFFEDKSGYRDIYLYTYRKYIDMIIKTYHNYKVSENVDRSVLKKIKCRMNFIKIKPLNTSIVGYKYKFKVMIFKIYPNLRGIINRFNNEVNI